MPQPSTPDQVIPEPQADLGYGAARDPESVQDPQSGFSDADYIVTVRGLVVSCAIGIRKSEQNRRQRVRVSVELAADAVPPAGDRHKIINYEKVVSAIREIAQSGHIDLCEEFADRLCTACFADPRVMRVRAAVEKLDVFPDAESVGAVIQRRRPA